MSRFVARFRLRTLLLLPVLVGVCIAGLYCWPRTMPLDLHPTYYRAYYRGLGQHDGPGFFGTNVYKLVLDGGVGGDYAEVSFRGIGYNRFRSYYPDGSLSAEGECLVEQVNSSIKSLSFDPWSNARWGRYYAPDGTLGSEVKDGTGIVTHWTPDGVIDFQLNVRDYARFHLKTWKRDGTLNSVIDYDADGYEVYRKYGNSADAVANE